MKPGNRLGPYEIVAPLGAGGMGEVYRARDTRLGREVAIKVLPARLHDEPDRLARFEREARATAALEHPNILAVHDVGTHDGQPYIVTELLEGETLRDAIEDGLTTTKAVELATQIANGLAAAHEHGVVHRDLKPTNVFVTRAGVVKILDFGLAKLMDQALTPAELTAAPTEPPPTGVGAVVGTVGYMAPEQVRGRAADHRADIFAFGCVLYEMLAARRAFRGDSAADTAAAILSADPAPLSTAERPVPHGLAGIVRRCLEKRPDDRFQSARDVAFALQAAGSVAPDASTTTAAAPSRRSIPVRIPVRATMVVAAVLVAVAAVVIGQRWWSAAPLPATLHVAVLPIEPVGADPGLRVLADGLTGVVQSGVSLLEQGSSTGLWVVDPVDAKAMGASTPLAMSRKFNATVVVTGRLEQRGDRLRLAVAAVEPTSGKAIRRAAIEDRVSNLSAFQEEPVLRIAAMLGIDVQPPTRERLAASSTTMTAAFEAYLRGSARIASAGGPNDLETASAEFERAVKADPLFAAGWIGLARACLARFEIDRDPRRIDEGLAHAARAAGMKGRPEAALRVEAALYRAAGRPDDAEAALEKALTAAPDDPSTLFDLAALDQSQRRFTAAEARLRRAVYLLPGYWVAYDRLAKLYLAQGMNEAAVTEFRHVIECAPELALGYVKLGSVLCFLQRTEEGRRLFERSLEIEPTFYALSNLGTLDFNAARYADAAGMYERALALDDADYALWGNLAYALRFGAEPERSRTAFQRAASMAEERLRASPDDFAVITDLADYSAMLGDPGRGLALIAGVIDARPTDPQVIANVAECLWDLGDRTRALDWVGRAFKAGIPRSRFEGRPTLRDLVADERYRALVQTAGGAR